jgi:hypothetical protein
VERRPVSATVGVLLPRRNRTTLIQGADARSKGEMSSGAVTDHRSHRSHSTAREDDADATGWADISHASS